MRTTIQLVNHFTVSIMQLAAALLLFALAMPVQSQSLNPESVEFFYPDGQPLASVALDGCIALENITGQPDWLTATFDNEVCDQFDSVMIELALVSSVVGDLEPGVYEADLTITGTNSFEQPFSLGLPVTLTVDNNGDFPTPILTTNPSSLTFTTIQGSGIASPTSASVTVTLDFFEENCDSAAEPEISLVDDQILEYVLVSPTFGAGCSVVFEITPTGSSRLFLYINGFHEYPVSIIRRVRNGGSHAQALHRSPERGGTRFIDGAGLQRAGGGLPDQARQRAAGGGRRWAGVER